uniref:Acetoacetyl-CoA synthetase n=1 Tax=Homo sapiens TaxID=9606 RepID=E7EW25_HUMAN
MSKEERPGREEILECQVMWEPDSKKNTQMDRFRAAVGAACGLALESYDDLYHWSVESYSDFWAEFWKFSGIVFSRVYDEVVDTSKGIADVPEWFKGSRLNYAENLLRHKENDRVALYIANQHKKPNHWKQAVSGPAQATEQGLPSAIVGRTSSPCAVGKDHGSPVPTETYWDTSSGAGAQASMYFQSPWALLMHIPGEEPWSNVSTYHMGLGKAKRKL